MGKKRKIFILSAMAAGIAIFFGRKRMKAKSEEVSGDWMPDEDVESDSESGTESGTAASTEAADDSSADEEAEEAGEKTD